MMLIEETTVPDEALPIEDFKAHLRLGTSFGQETTQNEVLAGFLRAALSAIEARTGKIFISRDFSWSLSIWRNSDAQGLPVAPVETINRVSIVGRDGSAVDASAETYWLQRDAHRPLLRAAGTSLPAIPDNGTAQIEFSAGYGPAWADVPADLKQAVLMLAAHYYEYRHETSLGDGCMPFGVTSLIERYRNMRIGFGGGK